MVNAFRVLGQTITTAATPRGSFTTVQFCCCSTKAATDKTYANEQDRVWTELYLQKPNLVISPSPKGATSWFFLNFFLNVLFIFETERDGA